MQITDVSQNRTMAAFDMLVPLINTILEEKGLIVFNNWEKCIKVYQGEYVDLGVTVGSPVLEKSVAYKSMATDQVYTGSVPKELHGYPFRVYAFPVKDDDGEVVGNITICKSLRKQERIKELSVNIASDLSQISSAIMQISTGMQEVAAVNSNVCNQVQETNEQMKSTDEILTLLRDIASKTNLLGINAAIEAAHAGEHGRGFGVVAQEIRQLSTTTKEQIEEIKNILDKIQESFDEINGKITCNNSVFQEQAASTEEITASVHALNAIANTLEELSKQF